MTYYVDLMREVSTLCLVMSLGSAETFVRNIDATRLTPVEYVGVLGAAAGRIGGCAAYEPAEAAAAAARVAIRAATVYDRSNGDQAMDVIRLVTRYLRYVPAWFRDGEEVAGLTDILKRWVEAWTSAEAAIDPNWRTDETFPLFNPGGLHEAIDGQSPDSIHDPQIRALYTDYMERKARFLQRMRDQSLLRRALDEARDDYLAYVTELHGVAGMRPALNAAAAAVGDPALKAALAR